MAQEHGGFFLCQASNGIGSEISKLIRLTVHGKKGFEFIPKYLIKTDYFIMYCDNVIRTNFDGILFYFIFLDI